jgi:hypothetical protein
MIGAHPNAEGMRIMRSSRGLSEASARVVASRGFAAAIREYIKNHEAEDNRLERLVLWR